MLSVLKHIMKFLIIAIGAMIGFFRVAIVLVLLISLPANIGSYHFTNQLKKSLPIQTELIEAESTAAHLQGNGNGTEFLSVILVKSTLTKAQLEQYYQNYDFDFAIPYARYWFAEGLEFRVHSQVEAVESIPIETDFVPKGWGVTFFDDIQLSDFENIYFIAIYDARYSL